MIISAICNIYLSWAHLESLHLVNHLREVSSEQWIIRYRVIFRQESSTVLLTRWTKVAKSTKHICRHLGGRSIHSCLQLLTFVLSFYGYIWFVILFMSDCCDKCCYSWMSGKFPAWLVLIGKVGGTLWDNDALLVISMMSLLPFGLGRFWRVHWLRI